MKFEPGPFLSILSFLSSFYAHLLTGLLLLGLAMGASAQTCTNIATGVWNNAANWNCTVPVANRVPLATDAVTIIDNTTVTVNIAGAVALSVTVNGGGNASGIAYAAVAGNKLTVTNDVTINAPTAAVIKQIAVVARALDIGRDLIINGGSAGGGAGNISRVTVTTGTITVGRNVILNGGPVRSAAQLTATTGAGPAISIAGDLTVNAGSAANANALATVSTGTIAVAGSVLLNGSNTSNTTSATASVTSTGNFNVGGDVTITGGSGGNATRDALLTTSTGTITIAGNLNLAATVAGTANASITAAAGDIVVNGAAGVTNGGAVTVGAGTFTVSDAAATFTNSNATVLADTSISTGLLSIAGNLVNGSTGANTIADTIRLTGTGTITVGGTLTNNAGATVNGTITTSTTGTINANGDFLNDGVFVHTAAGNLNLRGATATMNGTFTRTTTTGTVTSNKLTAGAQTLSGTALAFSNFVVASANGVTLGANATVNTLLTLTSGVVSTGANTLVVTATLCAAPSVTRTNGWVSGNLQKRIPAAGSVCTFEVGGASVYAPITATFTAATAGNITAKTTDGDHASIATSGLDPSLTANRSWSLTSTVAQAAFDAVFNFDASDLDTDTAPATLFSGRNYSGGAWATPTTGTLTATSTELTGLTLLAATQKDFAVGEAARGAGTGSFNAVENIAVSGAVAGHAITGKIFTKLAGTALSIDLVALNAARTAVDTTFKGAVKVELLDSSSGGAPDANGCNAGWGVIQTLGTTPQFLAADAGRKQNVSITESNAWPNVRVRVSSPATGTATLIGCSGDNFAIRPTSFTSVVGGAPLDMNNAGTSGTPSKIAGSDTFTLIAAAGLSGYTGTPGIDNSAVQAHAGAIQNGSVSGSFPVAVSGTSTGTSAFTYSEVGNFRFLGYDPASDATSARGVYDDTFTAVDGASDCTANFSNTLASGKYGCKFGIIANSGYFGRFYPKDFLLTTGTLTNRRVASCAPASTFTYAGEQLRVTFTLTARNGAGTPAITRNYDPTAGFAAFDAATIANLGFGAVDLADATPPLTATALTGNLTLGASSGTWASGDVSVTADLMLTRAAAPDGPFESFNLGIDPVDADGVKLSSYNLDTTVPADTSDRGLVGSSKIRFGRLTTRNALGSELLDIRLPVRAEYFNATTWTLNADDACTVVPTSSIALGNYLAPPTGTAVSATNMGVAPTDHRPGSNITLAGGSGTIVLAKPNPVATGTFDVVLNLGTGIVSPNSCATGTFGGGTAASLGYLLGNWCGSNYDRAPSARVKLGASKAPYIYLRERY